MRPLFSSLTNVCADVIGAGGLAPAGELAPDKQVFVSVPVQHDSSLMDRAMETCRSTGDVTKPVTSRRRRQYRPAEFTDQQVFVSVPVQDDSSLMDLAIETCRSVEDVMEPVVSRRRPQYRPVVGALAPRQRRRPAAGLLALALSEDQSKAPLVALQANAVAVDGMRS